jgi:hypothetical protein
VKGQSHNVKGCPNVTLGQPFTLWLWPFFFCKCNKVVIRLACTATKLPPTPEKNIEG